MQHNKPCPCKSNRPFTQCCQPLLAGSKHAASAESLMRSRYTAYTIKDVDYLLKTWHPTTRPGYIDKATIPDWQGLRIICTAAGSASDSRGIVEFKATAISPNNLWHLHEISRFVKENGQWFYIDGKTNIPQEATNPSSNKVGRNSPCPCGSGRKHKKCCALA